MRYVASVLFLAVAAVLGSAAPPEAPAEVTAKPGRVKELVVRVPAGKSLEFRYVGAPAAFREMKGDSDTERVFWLVPEEDGGAHIVWWFTGEKGSSVTAVNRGAKPDPSPDPKPKPDPEPAPVVKVDSVWVVVVEDVNAGRTVDTAKALNDPFWAALKPKHDWRHYLSTAKPAVENGYADIAKEKGYPAVLILNAADGDVLRSFKLTTVAAIQDAVKAVVK